MEAFVEVGPIHQMSMVCNWKPRIPVMPTNLAIPKKGSNTGIYIMFACMPPLLILKSVICAIVNYGREGIRRLGYKM